MKKRTPEAQRLESEYLALVRAALADRRFSDATEIIQSVQEHIHEALAESPGDEVSATEMANVLERLGPPATFAQEENQAEDEAVPRRANQEIGVPGNGVAAAGPARTSGLAVASVLALPVAVVVAVLVGVITHMASGGGSVSEGIMWTAVLSGTAVLLAGSILGVSALLAIRAGAGHLRGRGLAWIGTLQLPIVWLLLFLWLGYSSPSPQRMSRPDPPASASSAGANDISPLLAAAKAGQLDEVKALAAKGVDANATGPDGRTALHWAASGGHMETAVFLLSHGAKVNAKDQAGMTALHLAAQAGHMGLVNLLFEKGADTHASNKDGQTALHLAASCGHDAMVRTFCDPGFHTDLNAQDLAGNTPLHLAAANGHLKSVHQLVSWKADASIKNADGRTPADLATTNKHQDVADFLRNKTP